MGEREEMAGVAELEGAELSQDATFCCGLGDCVGEDISTALDVGRSRLTELSCDRPGRERSECRPAENKPRDNKLVQTRITISTVVTILKCCINEKLLL